jgi:hypothetical protein
MEKKLIITPKTKVRELLDNYPELEPVLVELAPAFKKLKNPVLRNTIARVTTLQQASAVGNITIDDLVNTLRKAAGQDQISFSEIESGRSEKPGWLDESHITGTLDVREMLEVGKEPLGDVLKEAVKLEKGDIFVFISPFMPAPLIEKLRSMDLQCWTDAKEGRLFFNYVYKP